MERGEAGTRFRARRRENTELLEASVEFRQRLLQHNLRNRCVVLNHAPNMGLKTLQ